VREFGSQENVAVRLLPEAELKIATGEKTLSPRFSLLGRHNRLNAVAATAAAQCMDVQPVAIMSGLAQIRAVNGRLKSKAGINNSLLIDDTYNANPVSVRAAIDVLAEHNGKRILVLGDLAELGPDEQQLHSELGVYAQQAGIDQLLSLGSLSANATQAFAGGQHFQDHEQLLSHLRARLGEGTTVLVKGSRGSRMERIANALIGKAPTKHSAVEIDSADTSEVISL